MPGGSVFFLALVFAIHGGREGYIHVSLRAQWRYRGWGRKEFTRKRIVLHAGMSSLNLHHRSSLKKCDLDHLIWRLGMPLWN